MTRRTFAAVGVAGLLPKPGASQSATAKVGAAKDLLYQGLELLSSHSDEQQITRAIRYFGLALDEYPSFGDAHYYRYICLKRLSRDKFLQDSAKEKAERYHSDAFMAQRDPFVLAVPKIYDNLASVGQKWALVVGISLFQQESGAASLACPANDAKELSALLRDPALGRFPDKQVFELVNEEATTAKIKARLNTIATKAKPEDVVFIYLSTHGSSRSDDIRQVSYLYTYDTNVTSKDDIFGSALAMVEVSNIVSTRCLAQRTVLVFDTCHSGAGATAEALSMKEVDRLREGAGRYVLSSCQSNQVSYENAKHGYFTSSMIDQLKQRHGCIRLSDLFAAVKQDVSSRVARELKKAQDPLMFRSEHASEIILGSAPDSKSDDCMGKAV